MERLAIPLFSERVEEVHHGVSEEIDLLLRYAGVRHPGDLLLEVVEAFLEDLPVRVDDEVLRLEDPVDEPVAVGLVEDPDGRVEDRVDADELVVLDDPGGFVYVSYASRRVSYGRVELEK